MLSGKVPKVPRPGVGVNGGALADAGIARYESALFPEPSMTVTILLTTPLYVLEAVESPAPAGSVVVNGSLRAMSNGGVEIAAEKYRDVRGRELAGRPATLFLPLAKIDHIVYHEG